MIADSIMHDIRSGVRTILRQPAFSLIAIAMVAVGIGANVAIFSVVDAVFLKPLPYPEADRLTLVTSRHLRAPDTYSVSYLDMRDVAEQSPNLSEFALYLGWQSVNLSGQGAPVRLPANFVTPSYFELLGFEPLIGRLLTPEDNREGSRQQVAVLSHGTWQTAFGGDPEILNRRVLLNGYPFTIVGVLRPETPDLSILFGRQTAVFLPLMTAETLTGLTIFERRSARYFYALLRLPRNVGIGPARQEMQLISGRLAESYPASHRDWSFMVNPLDQSIYGATRRSALVLAAAGALVLLLICANLANLLLTRLFSRSREIAVRMALGAGSGRITRQLVTESLVLTLLGGVAGGWLASILVGVMQASESFSLPAVAEMALDWRALVFSLAMTILTGLILGAAGGYRSGRDRLLSEVVRGGRVAIDSHGVRNRALLVGAQLALASTLLFGGGLLLKSFLNLHSTSLGFNTSNLLTAQIDLAQSRYESPEARRQVVAALAAAAGSTPAVESAFLWSPSRLGDGNWMCFVTREGRYQADLDSRIEASRHYILPGALRRLGIPLLQGRDFTTQDDEDAPAVAIVSQSLASALWPGGDAVGRSLEVGGFTPTPTRFEVVGVVADARHRMRLEEPTLSAPQEDIYFSFAREPQRSISLLLRTREGAPPNSVVPQLRGAVQNVAADLPLYDITTMEDRQYQEESRSRFSASIVGAYSLLSMALAAIGLYGVLSHLVGIRTREIGIRVAVGASRVDIMRLVLGFGARVTALGLLVGMALAVAGGGLLSGLLFGVEPFDPLIFGLVISFLAAAALPACFLPARRAVRIQPTIALRAE